MPSPSVFTLPQPWPDLGVAITKAICETYLLENGMQQGDRLSMAWAVELRLPFVDYRLVETAIGLRKASADHMLPPKARFREVIKDYLPEWVLNRPKTGFTPPANEWIGKLNQRYNSELAKGYLVEHGARLSWHSRNRQRALPLQSIIHHSNPTIWPELIVC